MERVWFSMLVPRQIWRVVAKLHFCLACLSSLPTVASSDGDLQDIADEAPADFHAQSLTEARAFLGVLRAELLQTLPAESLASVAESAREAITAQPFPCRLRAFFTSEEIDESAHSPCQDASGGEDRSLGTALLTSLRRGATPAEHNAEREPGKNFQVHEFWPCAVRKNIAGTNRSEASFMSQRKAALWGVAAWLRRCGVRSMTAEWPTDDGGWNLLRMQVAHAIDALAASRSDGSSLMCARSLQAGPRNTDAVRRDEEEHDSDDTSVADHGAPRPTSLRCPRCAHAVAANPAAQQALVEFRRQLLEAAWESSVPRSSIAQEADCSGADKRVEALLASAWARGGGNALITTTKQLECSMCELAGFDRFRAVSAGDAVGANSQEMVVAAAALFIVRCATEATQLIGMEELSHAVQALETVVWRGVSFPLLHDEASSHMLALLQSGRLTNLVASGDVGSWLCDSLGNVASNGDCNADAHSALPRERLLLPNGVPVDGASWIWDYEQWALARWGDGDPLRMALAYLDLAPAVQLPAQVVASLVIAALWLRRAAVSGKAAGTSDTDGTLQALKSAFTQVVETARNLAAALLAPGAQFAVLSGLVDRCREPFASREPVTAAHERMLALAGQMPFWTPPVAPVADAAGLAAVASRLHVAFAEGLQGVDPQQLRSFLGEPAAESAALGLYEASLAEGHPFAAAKLHEAAIAALIRSAPEVAVGQTRSSSSAPTLKQESFTRVRGVRFSLHAGAEGAEILLERPHIQTPSARGFPIALVDSSLASLDGAGLSGLEASLDSPEASPSLPWTAQHPLRRLAGADDAARVVVAIQGLVARATGSSEPARSKGKHFAAGGGRVLTALKAAARALAGEQRSKTMPLAKHGDGPRLHIRCAPAAWRVGESDAELQLQTGGLEISVEGVGSDGGLKDFSTALSAYITQISESASAELVRARHICELRAAARLLVGQTDSPPAATTQGSASQAKASAHAQDQAKAVSQALQTRRSWLGKLAEAHTLLLRGLGFSNFDPGRCWDNMFTFETCCSVGDFAPECWQRGFSEDRCCGGLVAQGLAVEGAHLVAEHLAGGLCKLPNEEAYARAIAAWLLDPPGRRPSDGRAWSALVVDLLDAEARACDVATALDRKPQRFSNGDIAEGLSLRLAPGGSSSASSAIDQRNRGRRQVWLPSPWPGRAPCLSATLEPPLQSEPGKFRLRPWDEGVVALNVQDVSRYAERQKADLDLWPLARASPLVRSLSLLSQRLRRLQSRAATAAAAGSKAAASEANLEDESQESADQGWVRVSVAEAMKLRRGERVRLSSTYDSLSAARGGGISTHEDAEVLDVMQATGVDARSTRPLHRVKLAKGGVRYYDFADPQWSVSVLKPIVAGSGAAVGRSQQRGQVAAAGRRKAKPWPECVEQGETIKGIGNAALFVNLQPLGISEGCFREDCTHTDHFSSATPADCARICASVRACRWWTFWAAYSGGLCWLRRHDEQRAGMVGGASGVADCVPPAGRGSVGQGKSHGSEPNLFQLARSVRDVGLESEHSSQAVKNHPFRPDHPLHQWDLVKVLQSYGRLAPSQLQALEPSALQRSALRFARRAQHLAKKRPKGLTAGM